MKEYWEYTEIERATMTDDQVRALLDVELMTKGVLKPTPPVLKEIPQNPVGPRQQFYGISMQSKYGSPTHLGVCFETIEAAQKFMELKPCIRDYEYEVGTEYQYVKMIDSMVIQPEDLYSLNQINEFRTVLKQRKALTEENERQSKAFNESSAKAEKITEGVWKDWYQCRAEKEDLKSITRTYADYLRLSDNNSDVAMKFLAKVHPAERIDKAREWFPDELPDTDPAAITIRDGEIQE